MKVGVAFVASNDTHVDLFRPVIAELEGHGTQTILGCLDSLYGQGAAARAANLELQAEQVAGGVTVTSSFYRRSVHAIWRDVLRCRRPAREWLAARAPEVVVVGNDRGLIEKLIIHAAHAQGCRVVLVQDGVLAPVPPRPAGLHPRMFALTKRAGSVLLRAIGLPYLSASRYGQGGADVLCASGPHGAETFRLLGVPARRIVVTGQPRFDAYRAVAGATEEERQLVVAFTTPFEDAGIGEDLQGRQIAMVAAIAQELRARGVQFRVKPHPREAADAYATATGDASVVVGGSAVGILRLCAIAIVGMSTVVDEAGLLGVPIVVPGQVIHAGRLDRQLPPADQYPRFETAREGADLICSLLEDDGARQRLLRRQQDVVSLRIFVDDARTAAAHVAGVIQSVTSCAS